jgi:hypothetical protein
MPNLTETATWDAGVYQLEENDLVQGGPGEIDNLQAQALANRTAYLKDRADVVDAAAGPFADLGERLDAADVTAASSGAIVRVIAASTFL